MSQEMATRFIAKVNADKGLQNKLASLPGNFDSLRTIAVQVGCQFTIEDWLAAARAAFTRELTDKELEGVTAGGRAAVPAGHWAARFLTLNLPTP